MLFHIRFPSVCVGENTKLKSTMWIIYAATEASIVVNIF